MSMNKEYLELLIDPASGSSLSFDEEKGTIKSLSSDEEYKLESGVPIIKKKGEKEGLESSELHDKYSSEFHYNSHYEIDAESFDYFKEYDSKATHHEHKRLHEQIFTLIKKKEGIILDVGCGNAWVSKMGNKQGLKVISMDISLRNTITALKNNPHTNHFGLVADVYNLPIKDKSMDYIVASEIMEHVTDPGKFIEILYGKLKEGGKLIVTTPYNEKIAYNLCVHCNKLTPEHAHLHSFSEKNINNLMPEKCEWRWIKFSNKYLARLRTHIILKYAPFRLWQIIDTIVNKIVKEPTRLLIEIDTNSYF